MISSSFCLDESEEKCSSREGTRGLRGGFFVSVIGVFLLFCVAGFSGVFFSSRRFLLNTSESRSLSAVLPR